MNKHNTLSSITNEIENKWLTCWLESGLPFQGFCNAKNRIDDGTRQQKMKSTTEAPVWDKYRYIE